MKTLRGINLSAALVVLVCFFLPWVQVSCAGAKETLSGLDLARNSHTALWLIPISILVLLVLEIIRAWKTRLLHYSIVSFACGVISVYLMNRERLRVRDEEAVIAAQLTGWFWLGFFSSLALAISGLILFLRANRSPGAQD